MKELKPSIESNEVIDILCSLIVKYDGFHEQDIVKTAIPSSEPFKRLVSYINKHYIEKSKKQGKNERK